MIPSIIPLKLNYLFYEKFIPNLSLKPERMSFKVLSVICKL